MSIDPKDLGRLEQIKNLRDIWVDEARDFTPWLAERNNIQLLGDTIGIDLEVQAVEKNVGPYSADILCKDTATDAYVLIENQLEKTDHKHLGQLLTYAAGLDVVTIVWIADRFTDEHRAALDWLNEQTNDDLVFFGIEIELWKIGSSEIAPKFNLISKPNEWTHTIKESMTSNDFSDTQKIQHKFWTYFIEQWPQEFPIRPTKPRSRGFMIFSIGRSKFTLFTIASTNPAEIRVYLRIKDIRLYKVLELEKDQIVLELGEPAEWKYGKNQKSFMIILHQSADINNEKEWPKYFEWLYKKLELFHSVFYQRIQNLSPDHYIDINDEDYNE